MRPSISILMACRNPHARFLREAVLSVEYQTHQTWELIVVYDADDAAFLPIWSRLGRIDPRIRLTPNRSNGLCGALNTAASEAQATFCAILHSDDRLDLSAVQVLDRYISESRTVDFFHSARRYIDAKSRFISSAYPPRVFASPHDFKHSAPVKHLMCWNKEMAERWGGFDEELGPHGADDYEFPWRMAESGLRFLPIPECLYHYRDHRAHYRLTTDVPFEVQTAELSKIFRKHRMTEPEIEAEIKVRQESYLRQAQSGLNWSETYQ